MVQLGNHALQHEYYTQIRIETRENKYESSTLLCGHCRQPLFIVPGDKLNMLQCQNLKCPRDHQPQGYL